MQITPHLHAIRIPFQIPHPSGVSIERYVYAYLLVGDQLTLIDSGVAGSERVIAAYLQTMGKELQEIDKILHTHAHPDHIGATRAIQKESGCRIGIHWRERAWLEDVDCQARERPVPGFNTLVGDSVPVDDALEGGECLLVGDLQLQILHTPGHSPGSLSFLVTEDGALLSGDLVPRSGDLPIYEDPRASVASLRRLRKIPDLQVLLSSWDEPRYGDNAYRAIDEGIRYIERIESTVRYVVGTQAHPDPKESTQRVLELLEIPPILLNPLVEKTIKGHLCHLLPADG